jgi:hypothetical protein
MHLLEGIFFYNCVDIHLMLIQVGTKVISEEKYGDFRRSVHRLQNHSFLIERFV